jgi:ferredoxin
MEWITILFRYTLVIISLLMLLFTISSLLEKEKRAAGISVGISVFLFCFVLFSYTFTKPLQNLVNLGFVICTVILLVLFIIPPPKKTLHHTEPVHRVDERDIMFARARLKTGTDNYQSYYQLRPKNKAVDDAIRAAPGLLSKKSKFFNPYLFSTSNGNFFLTEALHHAVDGPVAETPLELEPRKSTFYLKELTQFMGAKHVGITRCNPVHFYSHIGRGSGTYGEEILVEHEYAIAFTVEMDYDMIGANPLAPGVVESSRQYVEAAKIAVTLAATIRELGYAARAHIDGNYRLIVPLVARDAGLGEIGRMGLLITPDLGPRVRIGIVTTNLPLEVDERIEDESVLDFCSICKKCADNCPGRAISYQDREIIDSALRWKINSEACFGYWVQCGTDCGRCMTVCPYAHKNNMLHSFVRWGIRKSYLFRRFALIMDDFLYGRKPKRRKMPEWIVNVK